MSEYTFTSYTTGRGNTCLSGSEPGVHKFAEQSTSHCQIPHTRSVIWIRPILCTHNSAVSCEPHYYTVLSTLCTSTDTDFCVQGEKKAANNWAPYFTCHNTKFSHLGCHTPGICVPLIWTVTLSWQLAKQPCMKNSQVHKLFNSCQLQYQHNPNTTYTKRHKNSEERFTLLRNTKHKSKLS